MTEVQYCSDNINIIIMAMVTATLDGIRSIVNTHRDAMTMTLHQRAQMSIAILMLTDYRDPFDWRDSLQAFRVRCYAEQFMIDEARALRKA